MSLTTNIIGNDEQYMRIAIDQAKISERTGVVQKLKKSL